MTNFGISVFFSRLVRAKMRLFSNFSGVCLLFSLWYFHANGQIGGTQHYGNRIILMGKWYQAGSSHWVSTSCTTLNLPIYFILNTTRCYFPCDFTIMIKRYASVRRVMCCGRSVKSVTQVGELVVHVKYINKF